MNGDLEHRVAGNLNISFNYVEGESLLMALKDLAISSGSACTSAQLEPSYVLRALGRNDELAHSSIRFSSGVTPRPRTSDYRRPCAPSGEKLRAIAAVGYVSRTASI